MYILTEKVFIAWGQNIDLALKLSDYLTKLKIDNTIGGYADVREEADDHIGNRVINQMRRCSRAIILAQGKRGPDGSITFRPNLMFEWGYLLARLPKGSIMIALIETPREAVASDLQGIFSQLVPKELTTVPKRARWIADRYCEARLPDRFQPFDTIYSWSKVKTFLTTS
ncbi:TIR domain-containing protein [Geminicoccus roseus]|uniref:TIR domain-containing protein n=1 Tax=Geminicoccus roseus TaxID=404900 RepID=UPI00146F968B|nr:TIR domain-containing protein [Geminicoccus roseus]